MGNPQPVFCMTGLRVVDSRIIGADHLRLKLKSEAGFINAIGWRMAGRNLPDFIDIAGSLEIDRWGGNERLQFNLKDFRKSESIYG